MDMSIEELKQALEQERKAKEKLEKTYTRKIKKIEKSLLLCEQTRDNYNSFYLKSIDSLNEKQKALDIRNQELSEIKNYLYEQNYVLQKNQKELEKLNHKLNISANIDGLTGLSNRKSFDETMRSMMDQPSLEFSLFFIDLDGFKSINDNFGHDAGDHLLKVISLRLQSIIRENDQIFRLGGDEFVILINKENTKKILKNIAYRAIDQCCQEVVFDHFQFNVSASIGIARYPVDYQKESPDNHLTQIRKFADAALYRAKSLGKNQFYFYNSDFSKEKSHKERIGKAIREAVINEDFDVYFQTQFSTINEFFDDPPLNGDEYSCVPSIKKQDFSVIGAEALLRWNNNFNINTEALITWADKLNITKDIDLLVLKKVCLMLHEHSHILDEIQYVAVNFCSETFASSYHISKAIELTKEFSISPQSLMIELTERAFLSRNKVTQQNIALLEDYGFQLGLDDFGTGYSSLECLNRINFDLLKIDKSFSREIDSDKFNKIVVDHISAFATDLGIDVIVEGVETEKQLRFIQSLGVHRFQGFFFSKPVIQSEFVQQFPNKTTHLQKASYA